LEFGQVDPQGKSVLDVGSGFGFFVDYFLERGAAPITGLDIAPASVEYLRQTYPQGTFHCVDIGAAAELPGAGPYDIVSVVSVLYHLVEEAPFKQALRHICRAVAPGGHLLVSDMFAPTWQPLSPGHVQFRDLAAYHAIFKQFKLQIIGRLPIYYLMNRTFVPRLAPPILGLAPVTRLLARLDRWLRAGRVKYGAGLKLLLAKRVA
jgi:2-polyprenyl-3-methyl-5-hydroxy-6-metoxy-1,4-benzoquinol methylase